MYDIRSHQVALYWLPEELLGGGHKAAGKQDGGGDLVETFEWPVVNGDLVNLWDDKKWRVTMTTFFNKITSKKNFVAVVTAPRTSAMIQLWDITFTSVWRSNRHHSNWEDSTKKVVSIEQNTSVTFWAYQFIEDVSILPVGTGHSRWKNVLHMWLDSKKMMGKKRVTIAIIDSAKTKQFMNNLNSNLNLFVVVDECHRIGAPSYEEICSLTCSIVVWAL